MTTPLKISDLEVLFVSIVGTLLVLGAFALFVMIIVGGFNWLTAGADPAKAASARNTLTYAIIGFIIVVLAFLILKTISTITGVQSILFFKVTQ